MYEHISQVSLPIIIVFHCLSVSFYIYATGEVYIPSVSTDPLTSDDNLSIVAVAKGGKSALWGAIYSNEFSL